MPSGLRREHAQYITSLKIYILPRLTAVHSRPQRPRSVWSALKITTSGQVQRHSGFEWLCQHNRLRPEPIRFVRLDSEHAHSNGKSVNRGLPELDLARGRNFQCWPKGSRPLGTRMTAVASRILKSLMWIHRIQKKPKVAPKRGLIALAVSGKYSKQHGKQRREVVNLSSDDIPGVSVSEGKIEKLTPRQLKFSLRSRRIN